MIHLHMKFGKVEKLSWSSWNHGTITSLLLNIMSIKYNTRGCIIVIYSVFEELYLKVYIILTLKSLSCIVFPIAWGQTVIQVWGDLIHGKFLYFSECFIN